MLQLKKINEETNPKATNTNETTNVPTIEKIDSPNVTITVDEPKVGLGDVTEPKVGLGDVTEPKMGLGDTEHLEVVPMLPEISIHSTLKNPKKGLNKKRKGLVRRPTNLNNAKQLELKRAETKKDLSVDDNNNNNTEETNTPPTDNDNKTPTTNIEEPPKNTPPPTNSSRRMGFGGPMGGMNFMAELNKKINRNPNNSTF